MKTKKTESYTVATITSPNRDNFNGNPDVETNEFDTLEEATANYKELATTTTSEYGKSSVIELRDNSTNEDDELINEDPLELTCLKSAKIPEGSVIVTFKHVTYMNYAFNIIDVRLSNGEKYEDLNDNYDSTFANWDCVLESVEELKNDYEGGYGRPFDKINAGLYKIEEFLRDNNCEGYTEEEEEEEEA